MSDNDVANASLVVSPATLLVALLELVEHLRSQGPNVLPSDSKSKSSSAAILASPRDMGGLLRNVGSGTGTRDPSYSYLQTLQQCRGGAACYRLRFR